MANKQRDGVERRGRRGRKFRAGSSLFMCRTLVKCPSTVRGTHHRAIVHSSATYNCKQHLISSSACFASAPRFSNSFMGATSIKSSADRSALGSCRFTPLNLDPFSKSHMSNSCKPHTLGGRGAIVRHNSMMNAVAHQVQCHGHVMNRCIHGGTIAGALHY